MDGLVELVKLPNASLGCFLDQHRDYNTDSTWILRSWSLGSFRASLPPSPVSAKAAASGNDGSAWQSGEPAVIEECPILVSTLCGFISFNMGGWLESDDQFPEITRHTPRWPR